MTVPVGNQSVALIKTLQQENTLHTMALERNNLLLTYIHREGELTSELEAVKRQLAELQPEVNNGTSD